MIEQIRSCYIADRVQTVDSDFLDFEEEMSSNDDKASLLKLLSRATVEEIKLSNPHNSILLYCTGLSDEFDFQLARSHTVDGSSPDVDVDYETLGREGVIQWVADRWGRENVASVAAVGTFKLKSILRKFFSVTEGDKALEEEIKAMFPPAKFGKEPTLEEVVALHPGLATEKRYQSFYSAATKLEDMVSQFGIHAAGIIISDNPVWETVPVWSNKKSERITQFDKDECENLGTLKFDFLGIDNLSIIKQACKLIKQNHGIDIDPDRLEDGDEKTYQVMAQGLLCGVFQMETSGKPRDLIQKIKPTSIDELSAITALMRPGPAQLELDKQYIEQGNDLIPPSGMPSVVAEVLRRNRYLMIYQEDVMALCTALAGFTLRESDDIRKAQGKKDRKKLDKYKNAFIDGCKSKDLVSIGYADDLWHQMEGFADYAFCRSHAVAYSFITYQTAWLKANYPVEFYCALLSVRSNTLQPKDWAQTAPSYVQDARHLGVNVHPPSINGSELGFTIRDTDVYFGLNGIRDIGVTATRSILAARGKEPFKTVLDFLQRVNLQKVTSKVFTALVKAGTFDRLGYRREDLLETAEQLFDYVRGVVDYEERKKTVAEREAKLVELEPLLNRRDQLKKLSKKKNTILSLEDQQFLEANQELRRPVVLKLGPPPVAPTIQQYKQVPLTLKDVMEQAQYIGCYVGQHPANMIRVSSSKLNTLVSGDHARVCGVVNSIKEITTKKGAKMAVLDVDDSTACVEVVLFPKMWADCVKPEAADLVIIEGKIDSDEPLKMICNRLQIYNNA